MNPSPAQVALCSTCGTTLNGSGECLACLMRAVFDPEADALPTIFGDYEVLRRDDGSPWELGRGAMGVTYRAQDKVLNRSVALKVIGAANSSRSGHTVRDRFLREARAAGSFRHPNVAGVFRFGTTPASERCYYAMELVEGETLEALVRRDGPLTVEVALEIAVQVTRALVAAAAYGLIHRDIKPGNIMLTQGEDGKGFTVKVIDFGLAKAVVSDGSAMDLTDGGFLGTPAFASPEQFAGAPADARSDIYSLGATLWYALTGEPPHNGRSIEEIRRSQAELPLALEKLTARKVPRAVVQLVRSTLAVDPAQRPRSARELMVALERCRARVTRAMRRNFALLAAVGAVSAALFVSVRAFRPGEAPARQPPSKSIALLPFHNLSENTASGYFADGVHEEILTSLAKIADLKVISRTSVMQFRGPTTRNLPDIAQQLGVAHVLQGSVQRTADRVRVTAQLIDARTDVHLWAERYEGELADVFAIQSEIAQKLATELKVALSPDEQRALQAKPTADIAAYELYLRARELWRNEGYQWDRQVPLLEQAVARDPSFVRAFCMLAEVHLAAYWFNADHTPARLELARKALEAAERLQPDAGEVHFARGVFHYWGYRDFATALAHLREAERRLVNDPAALFMTAFIQRRQGRWADSIATMQRILILDPRNAALTSELANNFRVLHRYDDARRVLDAVLAWKPDDWLARSWHARIDYFQSADLSGLEELVRNPPAAADQNTNARNRRWLALLRRDYRAAEAAHSEYGLPDYASSGFITPSDYDEGRIARGLGQAARAEAAFLRARERAASNVTARPDDAKALMTLARIDAALARNASAIEQAERAVEMLPVSRDAADGPELLTLLGQVYAEVGELKRALDVLEQSAALPFGPKYGELQLEEAYDRLREEPRFQTIVAALAAK